jgi:hypothetical protein
MKLTTGAAWTSFVRIFSPFGRIVSFTWPVSANVGRSIPISRIDIRPKVRNIARVLDFNLSYLLVI